LAFDPNGERIDCSNHRGYIALEEGSSWLEVESMHEDQYWSVTLNQILNGEYEV
jgi:hypothetical protein